MDILVSSRRYLSGTIRIDSRQILLEKLTQLIEHFRDEDRAIVLGRCGTDYQNDGINIRSQIETVIRASDRPILIFSK